MLKRLILLIGFSLLGWTACSTATPAPAAASDSFFSGQAWLDANANGQIDAQDTPLAGATFIVRLAKGEFGAKTEANGRAFVTVPGPVEYPITLTMQAPAASGLILLEPAVLMLPAATGESAQFLFGQP
ncbi:MAG: hypothetical protein OHK0031_08060 [Anaerolineales bacterium]